jgi:hypothetical protein
LKDRADKDSNIEPQQAADERVVYMSTEQQNNVPAPGPGGVDRDVFLEYLILLTESAAKMDEYSEEDGTIDITLNVGGLLVSGTLISRNAFVEAVPVIKATIGKIDERYSEELKAQQSQVEDRHFIHLKNARFFTAGGGRPTPSKGDGVLWRGQLNRVDGWTIGRFIPMSELSKE